MSLPNNIKIVQAPPQTIKVTPQSQQVTLKNSITYYDSIDRLSDVNTAERVDGAIMQYNANTGKYDVKPLIIDGGEY